MDNPLEDPEWVRTIGNELHEHITREAERRDRDTERRHKDVLAVQRDAFKDVIAELAEIRKLLERVLDRR